MAIAIRRTLLPMLALLIGAFVLGHSALLYDESRAVERHGLQAAVQSIDNSKKIKRSGDHVTFRADITFTNQDGRTVIARAAISNQALDGFRAGQPTRVRYLPDRPDVVRVVGEEDEGGSWLLVGIGCVALAYGSIGMFLLLKKRTRIPALRVRS